MTPKPCNHHALRGWALETVYAADGTTYKRCRRCGRVFYDRWPLEEALTSEPPVQIPTMPIRSTRHISMRGEEPLPELSKASPGYGVQLSGRDS